SPRGNSSRIAETAAALASGDTGAAASSRDTGGAAEADSPVSSDPVTPQHTPFSLGRLWSYCWRESLELRRDPIRATLALAGSLILMFVIGFGISLDVEDLRYAVLDRDQTTLSHNYALNL